MIMNAKMKNFTGKVLAIAVCMIALALVLPAPVGARLQTDILVEDTVHPAINYHNVILDGGPGDIDGVVNDQINLGIEFTPIPDFIVAQGSYHTSKLEGLNLITSGSSSVINERDTTTHCRVAVSDTDFKPPAVNATVTGSGTFTIAHGSVIHLGYFDDPENVQGANSFVGVLTPGDEIASFDYTPTNIVDSFSYNKADITVSDADPYSMTLYFDFYLTPGGHLTSRGQSMLKPVYVNPVIQSPEFPSPVLPAALVIGLLGAVLFFKRTREQ